MIFLIFFDFLSSRTRPLRACSDLEQANMLINAAIDDCSIINLRAVVLDELHMVDDDHRGYLMELIATKLMSLDQSVQIIGMSATLAVSNDFVAVSPSSLPTPNR